MAQWILRILEKPQELEAVENLQRLVWPGSETDIVPIHLLQTVVHNGGLVIGAYEGDGQPAWPELDALPNQAVLPDRRLIGFVFGFPGLYMTPDGPRIKHCSHMLGAHPDFRGLGVGFALKRAQWQMVRHQGVDRITWTFDPLLSRNAYLNIARLGAVCSTYLRNEYGRMRDSLNAGLPSDRFQVDWWVNSQRVSRRLSKRPRLQLDLAHFLAAGAEIVNPTQTGEGSWPQPFLPGEITKLEITPGREDPILLVEIPSDFQALRAADQALALEWREHTRVLFEDLFQHGYLVTDFIFLPGTQPRSFYVLSHGESTL